jgi:hypothetical protein
LKALDLLPYHPPGLSFESWHPQIWRTLPHLVMHRRHWELFDGRPCHVRRVTALVDWATKTNASFPWINVKWCSYFSFICIIVSLKSVDSLVVP